MFEIYAFIYAFDEVCHKTLLTRVYTQLKLTIAHIYPICEAFYCRFGSGIISLFH
jgi:hypothetical protein